ncbi:MAG: cell division protein FtsA [Candidatus Latescibacterota bacterium]|nr:cell division protein FtsA [Candidatus Latescibacterota bacterium]
MTESPIVVLDVGNSKTLCMVGEVIGDQIKLLGMGECLCSGKKRSTITDMTKVVQSIRTAVDQAERTAGLKITGAYVGMSGEGVSTENHRSTVAIIGESNPIDEDDIARALTASDPELSTNSTTIMHRIKQNYAVDGESVENPLWLHGNRLTIETMTIGVSDHASTTLERACQSANLEIAGFLHETLAAAETTLSFDERAMGVGLLDLGAGSSKLALFSGPIRHLAEIPLGAIDLTKDLSTIIQVSPSEAERLKLELGLNTKSQSVEQFVEFNTTAGRKNKIPAEQISEIIEARQREIFELIREAIDSSPQKTLLPAGLVLTGGGAMLKNVTELAEEVLDVPVRIGAPQGVVAAPQSVHETSFAVGLGMLRYAHGSNEELVGSEHVQVQSGNRRSGGILGKLGGFFNMF